MIKKNTKYETPQTVTLCEATSLSFLAASDWNDGTIDDSNDNVINPWTEN